MRVLVCVTALLLLAAPVMGGTASEPEITDAVFDTTTGGQPACPPAGGTCAGPGQVLDVVTAWVTEYDDRIMIALTTSGSEANKAYGDMTFDAIFTVAGIEFTAGILIGLSETAGGSSAVEPRGIASAARIGSDQYEFDIMRADIGSPVAGDVLSGLYIDALLDNGNVGSANTIDRAPDTDGVEYVFTLGAPPVPATELIQVNVTGDLQHIFNGTGAIYNITWTGPANVTMAFSMAGNGTVNLTVLDPTGGEQFACTCEANETKDFVSEAGNWTIHVDYSDFNGTAVLTMNETIVAVDDETDDGSDETDGNETAAPKDDAEEPGEDSPLPVFAVLAALLVAVVSRRR